MKRSEDDASIETVDETPQAIFARRLAEFERFRFERLPVLHEFCTALGFQSADTPAPRFLAEEMKKIAAL